MGFQIAPVGESFRAKITFVSKRGVNCLMSIKISFTLERFEALHAFVWVQVRMH